MPNTSSATRQVRVSRKRHLHNKSIRSQSKTAISSAESLISAGNIEEARKATLAAITSLDKSAEKKVIHGNNAARRKSRLVKKLNRVLASSAETKPEPAK